MRLEVKDASFYYEEGHPVFQNVSFTLDAGQTLSILGPNGTGKSTLLNCLAGLLKLSFGKILLDGKCQEEYSSREIARRIGYVPQNHMPVYGYTVRDFVVMGRAPYLGVFAVPGRADYMMADEAIEKMGICHLSDRPYTEISGGERQQADIARVLVQQPGLILMDEPTSALDFGNQMRTIDLVKYLASEGYAVIMTTHTPDHAIMLNDRVALLNRSGLLRSGAAETIMQEKTLRDVYQADLRMVYIPEIGRMACVAGTNKIQDAGVADNVQEQP